MKSLYKRIILVIILTVLAVSWFPSYYNAVAEYDEEYGEIWPVYCACQPDSEINVRAFPKYSAEIVGRVWPGDQVYTDGKKRGVWMHVISVPCEAGEGWIHQGYLSDSPVHRVDAEYTVTRNKTFVRKYMGGKVTKKLKKGQTVTVFFLTGDVAVTNLGYIVADYLEVSEGG